MLMATHPSPVPIPARPCGRITPRPRPTTAFTLPELVVVVVVTGFLALLALPALGNAKVNSRQLSCMNNLRQLGLAQRLYVVDYQQYTACLNASKQMYIWPTRMLSYAGGQRGIFCCPAAPANSWWNTNLNDTLSGPSGNYVKGEDGIRDQFSILISSRFSLGYNDWGLSLNANLGLGGDVDGSVNLGPVRDGDVVAPSQMIMLGDTPALAANTYYGANLDPTDIKGASTYYNGSQLPANRHQYQTDLVFTDGHVEAPLQSQLINSASNNPWRSRWNNDNQPHNEIIWKMPTNALPLDPAY